MSEKLPAALNTAKEMGSDIIRDPRVLKAAHKLGKRSLHAAGVTRKTAILRRTKVDYDGVSKAIANPTEAAWKGANQLRKDAPRFAFALGRATIGSVLNQRRESAATAAMAESLPEPSAAELD